MAQQEKSIASKSILSIIMTVLEGLLRQNARKLIIINAVIIVAWIIGVPIWLSLLGLVSYYAVTHREFLSAAWATLPRDIGGVKLLVGMTREFSLRMKQNMTVHRFFTEEIVARHPKKVAFVDIERNREFTFVEIEELSNQFANYFHSVVGLKEGDIVALYMNNCPEYVAIWLGLSKIGVVTAWINYNLKLDPLGHSIKVSNAKLAIVGEKLQAPLEDTINAGHIDKDLPLYVYGSVVRSLNAKDLSQAVQSASKLPPTVKISTGPKSTLCYIYTSGTTGLPKAALVKHIRYYYMARGVHESFKLGPDERIYITMPMYHSAAGILGVGQVVTSGSTAVIRTKFSASRFWDDCVQFKCTASQYIGELARYLLAQPFRENENKHSVWLMYGNGMRHQLWTDMVKRFGIKVMGEFYGSTEGNSNIVNTDNTVGACGFFPIYTFLRPLFPVSLVKIDETTGEVIRDKNGLCIPTKRGEAGQIVGKIIKNDALLDFTGYVSGKDTDKKILRDVYQKGDMAFASGDILLWDELGYLFFKDRTGDTFRWKGENVSTTEVETVLQKVVSLSDAAVYGVEIPGTDGRAGMAAIVDENENVDLKEMNKKLKDILPVYSRPVFVRFCKAVEQTGTYKLKKMTLQKEAFDLEKTTDNIFYMNSKTGEYELLTAEIFQQINDKKLKF